MSLTICLKKAGSALLQADKVAILERAAELRKSGRSAEDAGRAAVMQRLEEVRNLLRGAGEKVNAENAAAAPVAESLAPGRSADGDAGVATSQGGGSAATHADPGKPAEPATQAVVAESLQKAAKREQLSPKQMLAEALKLIDEAIARAPDTKDEAKTAPAKATIAVPGDGTFKIVNTKERLREFRALVEKSPGFTGKNAKPRVEKAVTSGDLSPASLAREMLDDGEPLNAIEVLDAAGKPLRFGTSAENDPIVYTDSSSVEVGGMGGFFVGRYWARDKKSAAAKQMAGWAVIDEASGLSAGRGVDKNAALAVAALNLKKPENVKRVEEARQQAEPGLQDAMRAKFREWAETQQQATFAEQDRIQAQQAALAAKERERDAFYKSIMGEDAKRPQQSPTSNGWRPEDVKSFLSASEKAGKAGEAVEFVRDVLPTSALDAWGNKAISDWEKANTNTFLSTEFGQPIDLKKPPHTVTWDFIEPTVRANRYIAPGARGDAEMSRWKMAHFEAVKAALARGWKVPDNVLYDNARLLRDDLNDDDADLASDAMVTTYQQTKDYGKAVQAYRDWKPGLDLKGFQETKDRGNFRLDDDDFTVLVERTKTWDGKDRYQARLKNSTNASGPNLTKQQAIDWAANLRDDMRKPSPQEPAKPVEAPVSSAAGQKNLAYRGSRIASLLAMNEQIRKLDPTEAWHPDNIKDATDLDALQDSISSTLVRLQREKAKPVEAKKGEVADNFGETLPPARRNMAAKLDESLTDEDLVKRPFSEIWPLAENEAIEDTFAAAVAHAARAEVPAKPRTPYKLKRWVESVKTVRELASMIVSGRTSKDQLADMITGPRATKRTLRDWWSKVLLLEQISRDQWNRVEAVEERPDAVTYKDGKEVPAPMVRVRIDERSHWLTGDSGVEGDARGTLDGNRAGIMALLTAAEPEQRMKFEIRQNTRTGEVFINKEGDAEKRRLMTFATVEEARAAVQDQYDALVGAWEAVKARDNITERDLRGADNRPRVGKDHRGGRDITVEEFQDRFGFRGGEFGKWVKQGKGDKERQALLNGTHDALMDLAELLNLPPRAMSLNGTLGIALGSRGSGWASAHFEPSNLVINLTKTRGAGTLAHEWFHALDNYFSRLRRDGEEAKFTGDQKKYRDENYITHRPEALMVRKDRARGFQPLTQSQLEARRERLNSTRTGWPPPGSYDADKWERDPSTPALVRPEVEARFAALVQALKDSPMAKRAALLDKGGGYWSRTLELAARAFESYVIAKMHEQGYHNDFLVNVKKSDEMGVKDEARYPYLLAGEVKPIAEAFDGLFGDIKTREVGGNVALFKRVDRPFIATDSQDGFPTYDNAQAGITIAFPQRTERMEVIESPGEQVVNYAIMPREGFEPYGFVELLIRDGVPASLLDIYVNPEARKLGVARGVLETILAAHPDVDLNISNIVEGARTFWERMGIPAQNLEAGAAYDGTLNWETLAQAAYTGRAQGDGREGRAAGEGRDATAEGAGQPAARQEGLNLAELQDLVDRMAAGGVTRVNVVQSVDDMPPARRATVLRSAPDGRVRGAYFHSSDEIYVVARHLHSTQEAAFVVMHEAFHRGLAKTIGPDAKRLLKAMYLTNGKLRAAADAQVKQHQIGLDEAIEEALADMAGEGKARDLRGWRKLLDMIRGWLAKMGDALDISIQWTDDMVEDLVAGIRREGLRAPVQVSKEGESSLSAVADSPWYSALHFEIARSAAKSAPAAGWTSTIDGMVKAGKVKADEVEWSGIREWLALQPGKVTREAVQDYLKANGVRVQETQSPVGESIGTQDFRQWQLPGGTNYREVLLTLPARMTSFDAAIAAARRDEDSEAAKLLERAKFISAKRGRDLSLERSTLNLLNMARQPSFNDPLPEGDDRSFLSFESVPRARQYINAESEAAANYKSNHWDQPNVLAHIRVNDRTDADGKRVLFVEELQSDWQQQRRKNLKMAAESGSQMVREGVDKQTPPAPFIDSTDKWVALALKRIVKMAVDEGSPGNEAWARVTKPQRTREQFEQYFGPELAAVLPLEVVDAAMLGATENDQVRRAVVESIPVNVVNILADNGITSEQLVREPNVVGKRLPAVSRAAVARGLADALSLVGARSRAVLRRVLSGQVAGRDGELDPAIRARDFQPDVVVRLLSSPGRSQAGAARGSVGLAPARDGAEAREAGLDSTREGGKLSSAQLAEALNRHDAILRGDEGNAVAKYIAPTWYERIAFITGDQSAERYDLSKHIQRVEWDTHDKLVHVLIVPRGSENITIAADTSSGEVQRGPQAYRGKGLDEIVGKEIAEKILSRQEGELKNLDLKVGGEGMKAFYDKIVPSVLKDVLRKVGGGQLGTVEIGGKPKSLSDFGSYDDFKKSKGGETLQQPGFDITPAMREAAAGGMPMFSLAARAAQTDTPEFARWFKDSKVVDAQGKPLVVYHGTMRPGFAEFDLSKLVDKTGFFFAEDPATASKYAGYSDGFDKFRRPGGAVMPVYLALQNPADGPAVKAIRDEVAKRVGFFDTGKVWEELNARGFDGMVVGEGPRWFIAQKPEQIKSATGNRGTFDPGEADIRLSRATTIEAIRDTKLPAGYIVADLLKSSGKLGWWHKTVGTMHNLAEREPLFKRMYDATQRFLGDVSLYATEAADLAPTLLPKLERLGDVFKSPADAKDVEAVAAPIFEGTLKWTRDDDGMPVETADVDAAGIRWTDAELRERFNLSDVQVRMYGEFRKATDRSLTNLAASHMVQLGGADIAPVRAATMAAATPGEAASILSEHLGELARQQPARAEVLEDTIRRIGEVSTRVQGLIERGYAPLMRFGRYSIDAVDEQGERLYFGLFDTEREANRFARNLQKQFPRAKIAQGTMSEQDYKMFAGISPETVELFGQLLGLAGTGDAESDQAFQAYLKNAKSNRSALRRLIHRQGVAGFNEDAGRVLAAFVYSNARQTAKNLHAGEMGDALLDIKEQKGRGELLDAAIELHQYVSNPIEEAQRLKGVLFAQFLGGSIAAGLVNLTQPYMVTFPYLSQFGGAGRAAMQMRRATADAMKAATGDAALDAAMKRAAEEGIVSPQEVHSLMAQARGAGTLKSGGDLADKASNFTTKLAWMWGRPFALAEQLNRRITFIAAYRMAVDEKMDDPAGFAARVVEETQFTYNKANRPRWARGAVGGLLFTFKQYSISYVELLSRMAASGPEGRRAAAIGLGVLMLTAGMQGLPGADDLDDVVDGLMQRLGYNWSTKQQKREALASLIGDDGAQFLLRGVSGLPGAPIDVANRLGLGNLIPGTGLLTKKADYGRDVAEIAGPVGSLGKQVATSIGAASEGNLRQAGEAILPVAAANLLKAYDMASTGMYRDTRGRKVIDTDTTDAVFKAIGFQPADVALVQNAAQEVQRTIDLVKIRETEIADRWARGIFEGDTAAVAEARAEIAKWNAANPEARISITSAQIIKRVKAMASSREDRVRKTAPKEIRAEVGRQLEAAR